MRGILSMCCTENYFTRWDKSVKYESSSAEGFSRFFGTPKYQKGYLVYVPSTREIISSYDVFIDEIFSSTIANTSQTYE